MKPEMILHSDLLDILFENRNKAYGAYALRKEYPKQLMRSVTIVLVSLACVCIFFSLIRNRQGIHTTGPISTGPDLVLKTVDLPPKAPVIQLKKQPAFRTISYVAPTIVPEALANHKTPDIKSLSEAAAIGTETIEGPAPAAVNPGPVKDQSKQEANGKGNNGVDQPEIVKAPEVQPVFPGGVEGWIRFLKKNLRPKESDEAYKITVIIRFVVNEDGSLTDLQIARSGGNEFDEEVLRVMRKSPKWIAGSNQGRKVKVFHSQPVIFINQPDE